MPKSPDRRDHRKTMKTTGYRNNGAHRRTAPHQVNPLLKNTALFFGR